MTGESRNRKPSIHAIAMSLAKRGVPFRLTQTPDGKTVLETGVEAGQVVEEPNPWDSLFDIPPVAKAQPKAPGKSPKRS